MQKHFYALLSFLLRGAEAFLVSTLLTSINFHPLNLLKQWRGKKVVFQPFNLSWDKNSLSIVGKNCKNVPFRNLNLRMRLLMRVLYRVIWRQQRHSWVTEKISLKSFQLWPLQFLKSISWVNKILLKLWPLFEWLFGKWVSWLALNFAIRDKEDIGSQGRKMEKIM